MSKQPETTMIDGAKPCPFCGSERLLKGQKYCVICVDCGATGPELERFPHALKAWNMRAETPSYTETGRIRIICKNTTQQPEQKQ